MLGYTSFTFFLCYFGGIFVLNTFLPRKYKYLALTLGSWIFYAVASDGHIIPLLCETLTVYSDGLILGRLSRSYTEKRSAAPKETKKELKTKYARYKRAALIPGVLSVAAFLLVCKYGDFFAGVIGSVSGKELPCPDIVQPLGISFFSLEAISYLADVYYGKTEAEKNPLKISLYLSFAFTCVEGPVARYGELGPQFAEGKSFDAHSFIYGAVRVTYGLMKKVIIADRAALIADAVFGDNSSYGGLTIAAGVILYTIQLYAEFSGVTDITIGMCETMGITLPENFNNPFFSKSVSEFWQRWHITLGAWLRDYLFYPVSLSKPFKSLSKRTAKKHGPYLPDLVSSAFVLFVVWFANGFWHGSGWKYIVYGLYYYALTMLAKLSAPLWSKISERLKFDRDSSEAFAVFRTVRTTAAVCLGMLIFRADSTASAVRMLASVFTGTAVPAGTLLSAAGLSVKDIIVTVTGSAFVFSVEYAAEKGTDVRKKIAKLPYHAKFIVFLAMIFSVIVFGAYGEEYGAAGLIYAGF